MYRKIENPDEIEKEEFPFVAYLPDSCATNITYRKSQDKWATLRFEVVNEFAHLRFKELFLDWFYPSFPKNLLKTFSSPFESLKVDYVNLSGYKLPMFSGKDYSGKFAACVWIRGTTIEIRSITQDKNFDIKNLSKILSSMRPRNSLKNLDYISRSYFAGKSRRYNWFEEERIGRMEWTDAKPISLVKGLKDYSHVSRGEYRNIHKIFVLDRADLSSEIWIDIFRNGNKLLNGIYRIDKQNVGFLSDSKEEKGYSVYYLSELGPWILRKNYGDFTFTVGISSGSDINTIKGLISDIEIIKDDLIRL
ncbi:MAG: hypothetical protein ACYDAO_02300 [Thermoplasmataceae archaeon]